MFYFVSANPTPRMNFRLLFLRISLCLALLGAGRTASADPLRVYQIGNSWTCINLGTWDIATSLNSPYTHGYHYAWNQTLGSLWAGALSAASPAPLQTALTTMQWDIVELQPWYENYVDATTAATSMANLAFTANPNTKILIFACGPESSQGPYLTTWNRTDVANFNQANFWKSKLNYELIVQGLRTNFPGKKIGIVPMGHCIAEVARRLQNGQAVPGITSVDDLLEQGGQHTSAKGSYIGQLAAYCTFFQQRPHGSTLNNISQCLSSDIVVTPEYAAYMWDLVWDVVVNEPYTLVLPEGTDNIGAFNFPGYGTATITGTNLNITVPYGTNVTAMAPTFNVSPGATCVPPSGTVRNFSTPQHYIVTSAGGATTKDFTVTVNLAPYEGPRIGVQRAGGTGGSGTPLLADQRAGAPGYKQINWNALASYASNVSALKDSAGNPTTAGFTCEAGGVSSNTGTGATPDEILFTGSQFRTWGDWTFNITGIPYASYDLIFYVVGPGGRTQGVSLTGGPTYYIRQNFSPTAAGYVDGSALTPFNYLQGTGTTAATATVDANYVVFSNLTGANKTVVIPGGFQITNSFNAFQIVDKSPPPGPQAMITRFDFGALGLATINGTAISLTVPGGTAVTALAPTFILSSGATCNRVSGAVTDFTTPQSYVVTSSDSLITQTYTVTVTVTQPPKDILTFGLPGNAAVINGTNITLTVPYGTNVTSLAPTYTVSAGASCVPASGSTQNFTSPVHYIVTSAAPASTKDYTVTVVVTPASSAKEILTFGPGASVNSGAGTIVWTVPFGTNVTALSPTYTVSALATGSPVSGTARNFTTPQTYTITAQDSSTKNFVATVTVAPAPTAGAIIGVQRAGGLGGSGTSLSSAMQAGAPGYKHANWNALGSFASSASNLKDSTGATTTAAFNSVVGGSAVNNGTPAATSPDEILFSGGQYPTWGDWVFTITGIPYSNYSLVFYEMGPGARGAQATTLTGGPTYYLSQSVGAATAGYVDGNAATPFTYTRATSTTAGSPSVDANYVVFSGLSGANQTVTIPGGFQIQNTFNAFQIVDTSPPPVTVRTPAASGDDAEESPFGTVALDSATLGIGPNLVGVRFPNLAIPPAAIITSASVQFAAGAAQSGAAGFEITAQAIGNAPAFSTTASDINNRPITATSVLWQPGAWNTVGERTAAQRTPDLTALVQAVVSRGDWASGNALVLTLEGTGQRTADALPTPARSIARASLAPSSAGLPLQQHVTSASRMSSSVAWPRPRRRASMAVWCVTAMASAVESGSPSRRTCRKTATACSSATSPARPAATRSWQRW